MKELNGIDPAHAVSFSGHRPERLPGKGEPDVPGAQRLAAVLQREITAAIGRGMTAFYTGVWPVLIFSPLSRLSP